MSNIIFIIKLVNNFLFFRYNGNNVLNAIKLTLPILEMGNETVESELRSLENELSRCKSDYNSELFINESLLNFKKKIMDSIYTNNVKFEEAKNYILNTNCKLFRPIISFYIYHILNSTTNYSQLDASVGENSHLPNPVEGNTRINYSDDSQMKSIEKLNISYELIHIGMVLNNQYYLQEV